MDIERLAHFDPHDTAAAEAAFASVAPQRIACCNWPEQYPYAPQAAFRMFHTDDRLWLRFDVAERYTAALVDRDNGEVWTDSCVECFLALGDDPAYYNFETNAIGSLLLGYRLTHADAVHAALGVMALIGRTTTFAAGEPFAEREGDNRWSLTLAIPPAALFRHDLRSWNGVDARMNLYKCGDGLSHPHFLSWKPICSPKPDFHLPRFFENVKFK